MPPQLSVVIPCCNEAASILRFEPELFPTLDALGIETEVIIVDDGSSDDTNESLKQLQRKRPIKTVTHKRNRGLGAALRSGFAEAIGEWIVTLDADLTFHPTLIARLLARQREANADLIAGSPYMESGDLADVPWIRRLPSLMINAFYRGLFEHRFTAYTPMFRLYRTSALRGITLESEGFEISAEIAARFIQKGLKVAETPVALTTRREGASKLNRWRELRRHVSLIGRLLSRRTR